MCFTCVPKFHHDATLSETCDSFRFAVRACRTGLQARCGCHPSTPSGQLRGLKEWGHRVYPVARMLRACTVAWNNTIQELHQHSLGLRRKVYVTWKVANFVTWHHRFCNFYDNIFLSIKIFMTTVHVLQYFWYFYFILHCYRYRVIYSRSSNNWGTHVTQLYNNSKNSMQQIST